MLKLEVQSVESAAAAARIDLQAAQDRFRFVPNLLGVMANAPPLLKAYLRLNELFQETSFSAFEQQVVILAISAANQCEYCVAAHTMTARMQKAPDDVIESIRSGRPIADSRLEALRRLTADIVNSRGWPKQEVVEKFLNAGFSQQQVLEVILGVGMKTLSNYTNHIAHTPLDAQFSVAVWSAEAHRAG